MSAPSVSTDAPAARNVADILARIEAARKAALAPAPSTTLVAISKTFLPEQIRPVLAYGQIVFGENRVQEAKAKWPLLKAEWPHVTLHLVGPLQSNKVREIQLTIRRVSGFGYSLHAIPDLAQRSAQPSAATYAIISRITKLRKMSAISSWR